MRQTRILVTGATGTLGREILPRLVRRRPDAEITLLIRPRDEASAEDRANRLLRHVLHLEPSLDPALVDAWPGDVTWPRLGLDRSRYEELRGSLTHIVHCAASINLASPLETVRRVNLDGTREVLRLAADAPGLRRFAHLSTAFVAGRRSGRIGEDDLDGRFGFVNAYERSKYEAESLLREHMGRVPITVFRPSIVVGDSRDGRTCAFDGFYRALQVIASGQVRRIPASPDLRLDLVPVDHVAEAVARLFDAPDLAGCTVPLVAGWDRSLPLRRLLELAIAITGGPARPPLTFAPRDGHDRGGIVPVRLAPFFAYLTVEKRFDTAAARRRLGGLSRRTADPERFVSRCLSFCRNTDWGRLTPREDPSCRVAAAS